MFIIEQVFIEDRRLVQFLTAIVGLVHSMTPPRPVVNVQEPSKLKAASDGNLTEVYWAEIQKNKIKKFMIMDLRRFLEGVGRSPTSANYVTKMLQKAKRIKMTTRGQYEVIG